MLLSNIVRRIVYCLIYLRYITYLSRIITQDGAITL